MTRSILHSLTAFAFAALVVFGTTIAVPAQTNFYTDRAAFEADFPGLDVEDFEESPVPPADVLACNDLINSGTTGPCFQPGEIIPGVDFTYLGPPGDLTVTLGGGFMGGHQPDTVWGANTFADPSCFIFTGVTFAVGVDVYSFFGDDLTVNVLDTSDNLLGTTVISPGAGVVFMGVESLSQIGAIIFGQGGSDGELFDNFSMSDVPIPVELISFDAIVNGTDVTLNWATASETNNAGFEVQVLVGEDWNALGWVEGHGTTTEAQTYSYTAEDLGVGTHNFRLKQIDYDGAFEYSDELEVTVETPGTHLITSAYPNPFNPQSQFTLAVAQEQRVTVELYSTLGRRVAVLFSGTVEANQAQLLTIDGAGLASGMYIVRVTGERFADALRVTLLK